MTEKANPHDETPPDLTYQDLVDRIVKSHAQSSPKGDVKKYRANLESHARKFLKARGHDLQTLAAGLMELDQPAFHQAVVEHVKPLGKSTKAQRKAALNQLRRAYEFLRKSPSPPISDQKADVDRRTLHAQFCEALRNALVHSGISISDAVRRWPAIGYWLHHGGLPRLSSRTTIENIAQATGSEPGTLTRFIVSRSGGRSQAARNFTSTAANAGLQELRWLSYALTEIPTSLQRDLDAFVRYKMDADPVKRLGLQRNGRWTENVRGNCPSATKFMDDTASHFGFLVLPTDAADPRMRGLGFKPDELCFAMLADMDLVDAMIKFRQIRSQLGEKYNNGTAVFVRYARLVAHSTTGWLTQQPERHLDTLSYLKKRAPSGADLGRYFAHARSTGLDPNATRRLVDWLQGTSTKEDKNKPEPRTFLHESELRNWCTQQADLGDPIPEVNLAHLLSWCRHEAAARIPQTTEEFKAWCAAQHSEANRYQRDVIKPNLVKSRDAEITLNSILERERPITFAWDLLQRLEQHRPGEAATLFERAQYESGIFVVAATITIPLRAESWTLTELGKHLRRTSEGRWKLDLHPDFFKNRRFLNGKWYKIQIAAWAEPYFDAFLGNGKDWSGWRSYLKRADESPFVFTNASKNGPADPKEPLSKCALGQRIRNITKEHANLSLGIHWTRHVAATDFLKANSYNYKACAAILNDTVETVIKEYGHLKGGQHFNEYNTSSDKAHADWKNGGAA